MLQTRPLAQAASAISKHEFLNALSAWPELLQAETRRVGLAISGGVDSMALAAMMKHYTRCNLVAIIVDHGLRKESNAEAEKVRKTLTEQLDIPTYIRGSNDLTSADGDCGSSDTVRVETWARRFRYRLLGRACADFDISNILVAHHRDDQYETALQRLAHRHLYKLGPRSTANVPDCYGIHGLYQSGRSTINAGTYPCGVTCIEQPVLRILRPLLSFPKERLVETCRNISIPWVEDQSNYDRTLTERNSLRYILKRHQLPAALSKSNVLGLVQRIHDRNIQAQSEALSLYNDCEVELDVRSGRAVVWIPEAVQTTMAGAATEPLSEGRSTRLVTSSFLQCICSLVKPDLSRKSPLATHEVATFLSLFSDSRPAVCCVGDVLITSCGLGSSRVSPKSRHRFGLEIHRRLPSRREIREGYSDLQIALTHPANHFQLWDGRWWISVYNHSNASLHVRFFQPSHWLMLRKLLAEKKIAIGQRPSNPTVSLHDHSVWADLFRTILHQVVPSEKLRYTLPVIETVHNGRSVPIALPTLGLSFVSLSDTEWPKWVDNLKWDLRYKAVDLGDHKIEDCVKGILASSVHNSSAIS